MDDTRGVGATRVPLEPEERVDAKIQTPRHRATRRQLWIWRAISVGENAHIQDGELGHRLDDPAIELVFGTVDQSKLRCGMPWLNQRHDPELKREPGLVADSEVAVVAILDDPGRQSDVQNDHDDIAAG